jgi:protein-glutamine gamma-glutamyltransferase
MASASPQPEAIAASQGTGHTVLSWFRTSRTRRASTIDVFFELSTLGLVLCGYLAMLSTGTLDLYSSVSVSVGLVYRLVALAGLLPARFPGWLVGGMTGFAILLYPFDIVYWSGDFIQATVHLIFFLAVLKLVSTSDTGDHIARLVLSFLMLLVAAVLSAESIFFVFLLGFLLFSVMAFSSLELHRAFRRNRPVATGSQRLSLRLLVVSGLISAGILAMSTGLFYALPRSAKAALNQFMLQRGASSGFSREIILGRYGELVRNPAVVMRIREIPVDGYAPSPGFPVHWRGATLTDFDGRRWTGSMETGELVRVDRQELFLEGPRQRRRAGIRAGYHVHLEPDAGEHLFFPGLPEFIRITQPLLVRYPDHSARLPTPTKEAVEYAVFSYFDGEWELAEGRVAALSATDIPGGRTSDLLHVPDIDERIGELARTLTEDYENPLDKARILSSYLRGNYRYRLETNAAKSADPLSHFLFVSREGHCEYFASALAVMLREIGIQSRIATGFVASEYNPITGWHVVRMSDAHSWVEALLPGRGWFGFDPTPSSRLQPTSQVLARIRIWQDTIDTFWKDWVLSYNFDRQLTLAQMVERSGSRVKEISDDFVLALKSRGRAIQEAPRGRLTPGILLLLAITLSWWLWRRRRRFAPPRKVLPEAALLYQEALGHLDRRGYQKPDWLTSTEFLQSMQGFPGLEPLELFTEAYHRARYSNDSMALETMRSMLPEFQQLPRRSVSTKRAPNA